MEFQDVILEILKLLAFQILWSMLFYQSTRQQYLVLKRSIF